MDVTFWSIVIRNRECPGSPCHDIFQRKILEIVYNGGRVRARSSRILSGHGTFNQEESSGRNHQRGGRWCETITVPPL